MFGLPSLFIYLLNLFTKLIHCSTSEAEAGTQISVRHLKSGQHDKTAYLYPHGFKGPKQACWML